MRVLISRLKKLAYKGTGTAMVSVLQRGRASLFSLVFVSVRSLVQTKWKTEKVVERK